ncbi:MAG TPA: hypothetical protein VEV41_02295 [Terriglobales bacterium]|nr:hypothetical protein [Terriglobales bacterium]
MATLFLSALPIHAQQLAQRLILKDGSYQLITKYEVKGDRVRYYSAERGEWEEVPNSLVDWAATEKYEKDRAAGFASPEAAELDKELEAERKADEARSPHVAPGLRLPDEGGVLLLDNFQGPQLDEIQQSGGKVNKNMKGNILRATINPIASAKQTVELPGAHAKIQSHVTQPILFVNIATDSDVSTDQSQKSTAGEDSLDPERFKIVRMQAKEGKRIVGAIKIAVYGKVSQQENLVPAHSEIMPGSNWIKITPTSPLATGEYAVVEMLGKQGMNLYVWDFGVNPAAPANRDAWKPDPSVSQRRSEDQKELQPRKQ